MADETAHPASTPAAEAGQAVTDREVTPAATSEVHAKGQGGLPQFRMEYWGGQIIWLLILFAILYVLLSRVFVPRIRRVLDERAGSIEGAIAEARSVRAEADAQARAADAEMAEARASALRTAADAMAKSAAEARERQAVQEAELSEKLSAAEARIREARDRSMGSVREVAADAVAAITERLTGRPATSQEVDAALGPGSAPSPARA